MVEFILSRCFICEQIFKKIQYQIFTKNLKTHSPLKKDKILDFYDLIDHKLCFDYLTGIYVCCFKRELWMNNLHVCNLKKIKEKGVFSNFDNTAFFIKVFCEAFGNSKAYFCSKALSVNLSGVRRMERFISFSRNSKIARGFRLL